MLTKIPSFEITEKSRKFVLFLVRDSKGSLFHCIRSGPGSDMKESHTNIKYAFLQELSGTGSATLSLGGAFMFIAPGRKLISLTSYSADLGPIRERSLVVKMFQEHFPDYTIVAENLE